MPADVMVANEPPKGMRWALDFFAYELDTLTALPAGLVGGASQPLQVQIEANSYFKLVKIAQFSDIAAAPQTEATRVIPLVTMQINDTGSGRNLFNAPVPMGALCGANGLPFILPITRVFQPSSTIQVTLTNYTPAAGGTTYNVRLVLIGVKAFALGASSGR